MSKPSKSPQPKPNAPAQVPADQPSQPQAVASFLISRLSDGSTQYNFFGTDADLLGLLEYGKIMATDRARMNAAISQAQQQSAQNEALRAASQAEKAVQSPVSLASLK